MLLNYKDVEGPLHRRIYSALKAAIDTGRFGADTRLPSTRTLAADLKVSRNTVALAYEQLAAEGYIVAHDRSMMRVSSAVAYPRPLQPVRDKRKAQPKLSAQARRLMQDLKIPPASSYAATPGLRYDFRYGRPAVDEFPHDLWRKLLAARARGSSLDSLGYGFPAGYEPLRHLLTGYLARARGMSCSTEQIVIVNGSQQAFDLIARLLIDPGDKVVIEEPHYPGSRLTFHAAGAILIGVPVDGEGLDTTKLPPVTADVRVCCVSPCHQFPTGVIMPLARRLALMDWASRAGAWVVEDDYVSEFRYEGDPIEALHALDRADRIIYVGTFSKTIFPALRLAYVVLPPALVNPFLAMKWVTDRYTTMLGQEALADFMASGQFERYLRRARNRNAARRRTLIEALREHFGERVEIAGDNAGVHLLVWLNDVRAHDVGNIIARAARAGVGVYPISPYYSRPLRRAGLLFGYASLTEREIRAGIRRLAELI
jgi:GntR family transcriptional regulator / MocR family aminotransferase